MGAGRGRYRPPVGIPDGDSTRGRWRGLIVSIALHALVVFLLLASAVATGLVPVEIRSLGIPSLIARLGRHDGGQERVNYISIQAAPAPSQPPTTHPKPVAPQQPAAPTPRPPPTPAPSDPIAQPAPTVRPDSGGNAAAGGGAPDGAGSRSGPGAGAGRGNGAGGGTPSATKIKASYLELPAVGLDAPRRVLPFHLVATFEIAPNGRARILSMTPTRDGDFNRRIRVELLEIRWRAAALPDGTPVADTIQVSLDLD